MWLGYPGTSGAPFMDYIVTDAVTSPAELAGAFSEKLAYMPHTFFIGDHAQMLKHLTERVILKGKNQNIPHAKDTVTVVNATNLEPILARSDQIKVCHLFTITVFFLRFLRESFSVAKFQRFELSKS